MADDGGSAIWMRTQRRGRNQCPVRQPLCAIGGAQAKYDPTNLFRVNANITPKPTGSLV